MKTIISKQIVNRPESYIPKGCRKPRTRYVEEEVKLSIKEFSESEAPVAFIEHRYNGEQRIFRTCKGKFYAQDLDRCGDKEQPIKFSMDKLRFSTRKDWEQNVEYLDADSEDNQRKEYAKHVVIAGETYKECGQPYYSYQTFGIGCDWIFNIQVPETDYKDYEFSGISPDDRAGLQEKFDEMQDGEWEVKKTTLDDQLHFEWLEVLMPECCTHKFQPLIREYRKWHELDLDKQLEKDIVKFIDKKKKEYAKHFRYLSNYDFASHFEDATLHAVGIAKKRLA